MDKNKIINSGLIEQYVLGLTSEKERRMVEECAETYPEVKEEIQALQKALENYARKHAIHPPQDLKKDIMSRIDRTDPVPPFGGKQFTAPGTGKAPSRNSLGFWLAAASVVGLIALCLSLYNTTNSLRSQISSLQEQLSQSRIELTDCESRYSSMSGQYALLKAPGTQAVFLKGTGKAPQAGALVYYNPQKGSALLQVIELPAPPEGKQYQIWADVEGEMINMGLLALEGKGIQELLYIEKAESFNITLEPAGGSEHPTVELLIANGLTG